MAIIGTLYNRYIVDAGYTENHNAFAQGDNNHQWVMKNTPFSWGHFKRQDVPTHFALAEGWTLGDMYTEAVVASTHPNRGVQPSSLLVPALARNSI
jgi:phospholipase C